MGLGTFDVPGFSILKDLTRFETFSATECNTVSPGRFHYVRILEIVVSWNGNMERGIRF
jgi:hypothetical protein